MLEVASNCANCGTRATTSLEEARRCGFDVSKNLWAKAIDSAGPMTKYVLEPLL